VASIVSPFHSSVLLHFTVKLSKICEIFCSCEKKAMKLSFLHKNVNTFSHRRGNLMALTAVVSSSYDQRFEICSENYHYLDREHETCFELSKFSSYLGSS